MTKPPFFSVVVPVYNKENSVSNTIMCVLSQTFTDYELIIINDGSTDNSLDVIKKIESDKIKLISQDNQGVSATRNKGISASNGAFICFLDADDLWDKGHLSNFFEAIQMFPNEVFFANNYQKQINSKYFRNINNTIFKDTTNNIVLINDFFDYTTPDMLTWTSAVCIKKSILDDNNFDETITNGAGEDTDLWIRLGLKYPLVFNKNISATHRLLSENRVSNIASFNRNFFRPQQYKSDKNPKLNRFLDQNILSICIQHIIHKQYKTAKQQFSLIDKHNLSFIQTSMMQLPYSLVRSLYLVKKWTEKQFGFQLRYY